MHEMNDKSRYLEWSRVFKKDNSECAAENLTIHHMQSSCERLMRRTTRMAHENESLAVSEALLLRINEEAKGKISALTWDVHKKNEIIESLKQDKVYLESRWRASVKLIDASDASRADIVEAVSVAVCSGMLPTRVIQNSHVSDSQPRFVCINFADIRIYDNELVGVSVTLLFKDFRIRKLQRGKDTLYRMDQLHQRLSYEFIVEKYQTGLGKWQWAFDSHLPHEHNTMDFIPGSALQHTPPAPTLHLDDTVSKSSSEARTVSSKSTHIDAHDSAWKFLGPRRSETGFLASLLTAPNLPENDIPTIGDETDTIPREL